jgi:hypothetical protein
LRKRLKKIIRRDRFSDRIVVFNNDVLFLKKILKRILVFCVVMGRSPDGVVGIIANDYAARLLSKLANVPQRRGVDVKNN